MTIFVSNLKVPPPTKSQIVRTSSYLDVNGISKESIGEMSYRQTFLQVITDIATIDKMNLKGIGPNQTFEIRHSASFVNPMDGERFVKFLDGLEYKVEPFEFNLNENLYKVLFRHSGTLVLDDILNHTILLDKTAIQMNGEYDSWEIVIDYVPPKST